MSIEDQPTQQIQRPQPAPPMPGPLSPTYQPPAETAETGSTEVLSLDQLLDGPAAPEAAAPPEAPAPPTPAPAAPRIGAVPVRSAGQATPTGTGSGVRSDAAAAWRGGLERSRTWLTSGDNAVIAATALIAVLLLLAVALF